MPELPFFRSGFLIFDKKIFMISLEEALFDSRRIFIEQAVEVVMKDKSLFEQAVDLALSNKPQIANRATRVVQFSIEKDFSLVEPYLSKIVHALWDINIEIVRGGLMKIFADYCLPSDEEELGILADLSFYHLQRISKVATTKIYALQILYKISNREPDLKPELIAIIEDQMPKSLISFKTRGKKMLKLLYKEIGES